MTGYADEYFDAYELTAAQVLGGWNFAAYVYIAFDGPSAASPTWINVTGFVDLTRSSITITRGRQDGLADVSVGTCGLVVDNTDGRWTPSNAAGAWYGLIRKGAWLRVDVLPPSGIVSTRFVGFITGLPTAWDGLYANTKITASDRFLLLGQSPALPAMTSCEVLKDTSTGALVAAHYPLSEALVGTGFQLAFGDTSGNVSPPLHPIPWGSTYATYLNYVQPQGAPAPGFDGAQCVRFQPASTSIGAVLTTTVAPWNNYDGNLSYGVLELWVQTTLVNATNAFASLYDPASGCVADFGIDGATGYLLIGTGAATAGSPYTVTTIGPFGPSTSDAGVVLNDGNWHYVSIATAVGPTPAQPLFVINIDGKTVFAAYAPNSVSPNMNTLYIGGAPNTVGVYAFNGNISGVSWILTGTAASNYPAHYRAGYDGFNAETADLRIARIARYAGIPEPTSLQVPAPGFNPVPVYNAGAVGPWTRLSSCIHQVGPQSIIGRQPLDVMREAARTEGMPVYIDRAGYLMIQPCTTRYNAVASWSVSASDIESGTAFSDDYQYLVNQVTVGVAGGASQTINGHAGFASQARYGVYSQSIQTASVNNAEAANLALSVIGANADPVPRIAPLVVEVATLATQTGYGPAWYDAVLASDISTVCTVTALPAQAPAPSMSVFIEGYTESVGLGTHTFSFSTSPQTYANAIQLDSPTLGLLDSPALVLGY